MPDHGKCRRILQAFSDGCRTVEDILIDLEERPMGEWRPTKHQVAALVWQLQRYGRIRRIGMTPEIELEHRGFGTYHRGLAMYAPTRGES